MFPPKHTHLNRITLLPSLPAGLGMTVIAYDPYASQEKAAALGVKIVTMDEALAQVRYNHCCTAAWDSMSRHGSVWCGSVTGW